MQTSFNPFLLVLDGHSEALLQQRQLADQVGDGVGEGFLWEQSVSAAQRAAPPPALSPGGCSPGWSGLG